MNVTAAAQVISTNPSVVQVVTSSTGKQLKLVSAGTAAVYAVYDTLSPDCQWEQGLIVGLLDGSSGPSCAQVGSMADSFISPGQNVTVQPVVQVTTADIASDQIVLSLTPNTASGRLVVTLVGVGGSVSLFDGTRSGGTHIFSFNPTNLPARQYTEVKADWTVNGVTGTGRRAVSFKVLGVYLHTQYNTPDESSCTGSPENAYITNAACNFTQTMLRSDFIRQVNRNGSGHSINFGDVVREVFCVQPPRRFPPDAPGRSFRQQAIRPACGGVLNDHTVARSPGHPDLRCGDQVLIVGVGIKTVTDLCPGCSNAQLDNYTTNGACSGITSLGNFTTIRLR
jgi:hypothetical protein